MAKIYYKVVYHDNSQLFSVIKSDRTLACGRLRENYAIEYKLNEWVYPKQQYTNLMCFKTQEDAISFRYSNFALNLELPNIFIFKCHVKSPRRVGVFVKLDEWKFFDELERMIERRKQHKKLWKSTWPDGTIFCSAIKLLERVE